MRLLALLLVATAAFAQEKITVFAAASVTDALKDIAPAYEAAHDVQVVFSFAGSSTLAKQIQQGAPAEVFISADQAWMDTLDKAGLLTAGSRKDLLANRLVLIEPADRTTAIRVEPGFAITAAFTGRIALADPEAVPAGRYAKQAFTALGWWEALAPRVAPAADVRAALKLVEAGECDLGAVYATDAAATKKVRIAAEIPESLHTPIRYPAALTATAGPAARAFLDHLRSPAGQEAFRARGFTALP